MTKPIKVLLIVDHAIGNSGPHRNVVGSLNALSARDDIELRLLCGKIDPDEPYAKRCDDIRLSFEPHNPAKIMQNLWLVWKAVRDCDLIYVPTGLKSFLYAFSMKGKRKLVVGPNVTSLPLPNRQDSPGRVELEFMVDHWFEASQARRDHVFHQTGDRSVTYIHHAIDVNKFNPIHRDYTVWEEFDIPITTTKVLYVGRDNEPRKGVKQLLDAIDIINNESHQTKQFSFAFAGNYSATSQARISQIHNAYLLGLLHSDKLPIVYASSDISVIPSSWENFPFSVLEAMASGVAIIASHTGGIPEQIVQKESGILLDLAEPGPHGSQHKDDAALRLAQGILLLLNDEKMRIKLGENARHRVLEFFSEERLGSDLVSLFHNCINS